MQYRVGDSLQRKLVGNLLNGEDPHEFVIDAIDVSKNCYHVKNLTNQKVEIMSKQNIDLFFIFKGHTR